MLSQGFPLQQLHHQEGLAVVLSELVDGANIGMVECGSSPRFPLKAFDRLRIISKLLGKELERDTSAQLEVFGFINHAHPAAAQYLQYAVVGNLLTDQAGNGDR